MPPKPFVDREVLQLTRDGIWLADGEEITHIPTRKLFSRSLEKRPDGYWLVIGRESKKIDVEDTAYFVHALEGSSATGFVLILSDETKEPLEPTTLQYVPGRLTCKIKNNSETAKFLRAPYAEILRDLQEANGRYTLEVSGKQIDLGEASGS